MAQNFRPELLEKYCGDLYGRGNVRLRPVDRTSTVEVSGTRMREFLAKGDKENFIKFLPKGIDAELVWNVLWKSANSLPQKNLAKKPGTIQGTKPGARKA